MSFSNPRIIIIGAGAAGIAAAAKLYENGLKNIQILEGESRIGGRIYTIPFGDCVIDLGAQYCHGELGNVVYELAKPYDLLEASRIYSSVDGFDYYWSSGEMVDKVKALKLYNLIDNISEDSEKYRKYNGSFGAYMLEM